MGLPLTAVMSIRETVFPICMTSFHSVRWPRSQPPRFQFHLVSLASAPSIPVDVSICQNSCATHRPGSSLR